MKKCVKILKFIRTFKPFASISGRHLYVTIFICSYRRGHLQRSILVTRTSKFYHPQYDIVQTPFLLLMRQQEQLSTGYLYVTNAE